MRHPVLSCVLLALIACGDSSGPDAAAGDSATAGPIPPATLGANTMVSAGGWRCTDGSVWNVTVWQGPGARIALSSTDTAYVLPQQPAASGARYVDSTGTVSWWTKGDSATLERAGRSAGCGTASDVEF